MIIIFLYQNPFRIVDISGDFDCRNVRFIDAIVWLSMILALYVHVCVSHGPVEWLNIHPINENVVSSLRARESQKWRRWPRSDGGRWSTAVVSFSSDKKMKFGG